MYSATSVPFHILKLSPSCSNPDTFIYPQVMRITLQWGTLFLQLTSQPKTQDVASFQQ